MTSVLCPLIFLSVSPESAMTAPLSFLFSKSLQSCLEPTRECTIFDLQVWDLGNDLTFSLLLRVFPRASGVSRMHAQLGGEPRSARPILEDGFPELLPLCDFPITFHVPKAPLSSPADRNLKFGLLCSASISHDTPSVCGLVDERERGGQAVRFYPSLPTLSGLSTVALPSEEEGFLPPEF